MMLAFDTPQPITTIGRRNQSNVPAQSLILLNDPMVIEQCEHWAKKAIAESPDDARLRIERMIQEAFSRPPTEAEQALALQFLDSHAKTLGVDPNQTLTSVAWRDRVDCCSSQQGKMSRRQLLSSAACGFGSLALNWMLHRDATASEGLGLLGSPHAVPKVKSVIFLYMDGGPSQVDTFDPKPLLKKYDGKPFPAKTEPTQFNNLGGTLASPWKFQKHGQSGIEVSELFPNVAKHVDDLAVIRSMTSNFSEHTNANYFLHTGSGLQGRPSMGAWTTYGLGSENDNLPGFVVLNGGLIPPGGLDNFNSGFLP
ncbi:unnamed protein product, partial [Symbiodinium sp. CCMP2456]